MKAFDEVMIKRLVLANRFVRSATWEGLATDKSFCSPELKNC
jgi:2,4-dienoyl-CoA reductase-like NADH-dependent reductase (Old Yellow Enzyme family)